jgi:hypothetical protein
MGVEHSQGFLSIREVPSSNLAILIEVFIVVPQSPDMITLSRPRPFYFLSDNHLKSSPLR